MNHPQKKLRIAALVTDGFGAFGGIARYNKDFLEAVAKSSLVSSIEIIPRTGDCSIISLPEKILQHRPQSGRLPYIFSSIKTIWRQAPDLIFCGHIHLLPLAHYLAQLVEIPVWLQLHGIDAWDRPRRIKDAHFRKLALATCVSRYTRNRFLSWANLPPHKVRILPNTVALPPKEGDDLQYVAARLGLKGKKILLTVGRLAASEAYKGQDRVIRCLPLLLRRHPQLVYVIAGDGDDRPRLERIASENGVGDKVLFLGKVSDEELDALYRLADLFVMPSAGEGFGIVFLEAMARGTLALGLNADGSADPLQDGKLGMMTSEKELCKAIERGLQASPPPDLGQRVVQTFGHKRFQEHVHRFIESLATEVFKH